jgi:26S proteasome regulatory subunit N3
LHERFGRWPEIRETLLLWHRTACLTHNEPGQAALSVGILRHYLSFNLIAQADNFRLKSSFPEQRSPYLHARYLYYVGRINAVQLHYSDAFANLSQASRKCPQGKVAVGFRQHVQKLMVIVQLLMGDIPDRAIFHAPELKRSLLPYFKLTQAVRVGDLDSFTSVVQTHKASLIKDKMLSLITRLRHNVIKAGLRKISLSYSRVSIADIAEKLHLNSKEDAEYIVCKAIHDGVLEAVLNRENNLMYCKDKIDIYSSTEPQKAFSARINFCMDIHNKAVQAFRFAPNAHGGIPVDDDDRDAEEEVLPDEEEDNIEMG